MASLAVTRAVAKIGGHDKRARAQRRIAVKGCAGSAPAPAPAAATTLQDRLDKIVGNSDWWAELSVQGTSRKQNEDRIDGSTSGEVPSEGQIISALAVYDGHGGYAVSEFLQMNLVSKIKGVWTGSTKSGGIAVSQLFQEVDDELLMPPKGFFGAFGERGMGGSKCGSTCAIALLVKEEGKLKVVSINTGDARTLLLKGDEVLQLSTDHVPDEENERKRIERTNPNPKMPLVRFIGDCWRVGGVLALSRAFGDAFLKPTNVYEGVSLSGDTYSSGFGLVPTPDVRVEEVSDGDSWLIVSSDGSFANEERGGGGGLSNEELADIVRKAGSPEAATVAVKDAALERGSTDDISLIVAKL